MAESAAFVRKEKKNINQTEAALQMKLICLRFIKLFFQASRIFSPLQTFVWNNVHSC